MTDPVEILARGVDAGVYPGGQLAASRRGRRLVSVAEGRLGPDLESATTASIYDLASLTKPLATALLIGRAMEGGRCQLADPLAKYVPGVDPEVTLEHALEHAAGYPAHLRFDLRLPPRVVPGSWDAWRHVVLDAARVPRERPPGQSAQYSDIGFILLGAALEVIFARPLGQAFAELGTELFFRDLRGPPSPPITRARAPIAPTEAGLVGLVHDENCRAMGGAAGHAGLWGTAEGVLAVSESLVRAWHGGRGELLEPETVRRMWTPSRVADSTRTLGWDRPSPGASSTGGRWPADAVGHLGFTGTSVWIEPERALVVVLITNRVCPTRDNDAIRSLRPALHDAAWSAWAETAAIRRSPPGPGITSDPRRPAATEPSAPVHATTLDGEAGAPLGARPELDEEPTERVPVDRTGDKP